MAFKEAIGKRQIRSFLEPIMKVVVTVPEEYMGDVMGDVNSRRGQITGYGDEKWYSCPDKCVCPAVQHVRLCHRPAFKDPGTRQLLDGAQPLMLKLPKSIARGNCPADRTRKQTSCKYVNRNAVKYYVARAK